MAEHKGLKNLYTQVVAGDFGWDRWGLLGVLSDYVLNYKEGGIVEIGCGESSIVLSKLAEKYKVWCYHIEFSRSGVENMKKTKGYFGKYSLIFNMTSDEFFEKHRRLDPLPDIAVAFIDGDHNYLQVRKDFFNVYPHVVKGGYIFLHDTCPPDDSWKVESKCGSVYKLRNELKKWDYIDMWDWHHSAFNVGLTMIRKKKNHREFKWVHKGIFENGGNK